MTDTNVRHLPVFTHTEDCDTMAIGRFVQYLDHHDSWDRESLVRLGSVAQPGDEFRGKCDCGKRALKTAEEARRLANKRHAAYRTEKTADTVRQANALVTALRAELGQQ